MGFTTKKISNNEAQTILSANKSHAEITSASHEHLFNGVRHLTELSLAEHPHWHGATVELSDNHRLFIRWANEWIEVDLRTEAQKVKDSGRF